MSDMLKILKGFDAIEKKKLNEAFVVECPPDMPTAMNSGGEMNINISGDAASMAQILQVLAGVQGGKISMGASMHDDPAIPGRDDVEGDQDLNQGIIGALTGAGLGGAAGLALGGPMGGLTGGLAGAAAGDQLTDKHVDDPAIPGRDDVEGDTDLQADIAGLATAAGDAISNFAGQALQKGAEVGANLGRQAAQRVASTDTGMNAIRRLAGVSDLVPDAVVGMGAGARGADIGSKIGKGAVAVGAPAAAIGGMAAMGNNKDDKQATTKPNEEYMTTDELMAGGDDIHAPKHPKDIRVKDAPAYDKEAVEEYENEPDENYSDHDMMLNKLSGGINGKKQMYKAAQRGDNAMAVEGAPALSPKFIKHLQVTFGDKPMLSRSETRKIEDMLNKLSIENIKTLLQAGIPNVSDMAKDYLRNNTPGGMKNYDEDMAVENDDNYVGAVEYHDGTTIYPKIGDTVELFYSDFTDSDDEADHKPNAIGKIVGKGKRDHETFIIRWRDHTTREIEQGEFSAADEFKILNKDRSDPSRIKGRKQGELPMPGGKTNRRNVRNPAGNESVTAEMKSRLSAMLAEKQKAKPDFLDMDKDGDKKEPMKKAIADKKAKGPVKETELDEISSDLAKRYTKAAKMDRDFNDDDIERLSKSGQSTRDMHKRNSKRTKGINRAAKRMDNVKETFQDLERIKQFLSRLL